MNRLVDLRVLHLWTTGARSAGRLAGQAVDRMEEEPVLEQIMGLPTHVLLVHTAVVMVPLLAAVAACYAVVPLLRPVLRWLVIALAVVAPLSALLAKVSGDAFFRALQDFDPPRVGGELVAQVQEHQQYGSILAWVSGALGIATLVLVYAVDRSAREAPWGTSLALRGRADAVVASRGFATTLTFVTLGLAVLSLVYVYLTGDSGARMVWEQVLREG